MLPVGSTFEEVADWTPADLLVLGVAGSTAADNGERCRRARSILGEYEPYTDEFDEPPMLRLLVKHRGNVVAAADDPAVVEQVRRYLRMDPFRVQAWQDLERNSPSPAGCPSVLGAKITEGVNEVRERVGLHRLTMRQVAARRLTDVIRQVTQALEGR